MRQGLEKVCCNVVAHRSESCMCVAVRKGWLRRKYAQPVRCSDPLAVC